MPTGQRQEFILWTDIDSEADLGGGVGLRVKTSFKGSLSPERGGNIVYVQIHVVPLMTTLSQLYSKLIL